MINNQLIIDEREVGKTTYLYTEAVKCKSMGLPLFILDSATEHVEKSLLKKFIKTFPDSIVSDMREVNNVVLGKLSLEEFVMNYQNFYPFNEIMQSLEKTMCFDLSFFLEKGHEIYELTGEIKGYRYYRNLYNLLAQQIILVLMLMEKEKIINKDCMVILDEIEFPKTDYNIADFQNNISFLGAVHPENAFGTFYQSFDKINSLVYRRRKD